MTESACPHGQCDGSGFVYNEQTYSAAACKCEIERRTRRRLCQALPPGRYREVARDRNPLVQLSPAILGLLDAWLGDLPGHLARGAGLWLEGRGRHGKRSAAALLVKEAVQSGRSAEFWDARSMIARAKNFEQDPQLLLDRLIAVDLLALVDLGFDNPTGWVREQLHILMDQRYVKLRSVIVTTEHSAAELEAQLGPAIVDRIGRICGDPLLVA